MSQKYSILVGDIGGTNIRLNILQISKDPSIPHKILNKIKLLTQKYPSLEAAIEEYISPYKNTENYPLYAVIGLPGIVENNELIASSNISHWPKINGNEYAKKFGIKKFIFLNDFVCNAYGIQTNLKKYKDYLIINDVPEEEGGPKSIIGPGSGLGNAFLIKNPENKFYTIGTCDGGHMDFFSKNKKFFELCEFVKKFLGQELISVERICSGQGLIPIYKFLLEQEKDINRDIDLGNKIDEINDLKNLIEIDQLNLEIVNKGLTSNCPLCKKVLEFFIEIFGEIAGNMALNCLPTGGMYLVGGLSLALKDLIKNSDIFMKHFVNKDNIKFFIETFPVYLVINEELGLLGSAEYARRLIENNEI